MELHTLGVDGGYTQQDVIEVARSFTGWTIRDARTKPEFAFDARVHDPKPKRVMGKNIHAGGVGDGEQVLDLLAHDPIPLITSRSNSGNISLQILRPTL